MYSIILKNGSVVDGTGVEPRIADLAIRGDRIVAVDPLPPTVEADVIVDCSGLVVSPGFIDIHTHADIALLQDPYHLPAVTQGVTTEVFSNCGLGFAPATGSGVALQRANLGGLFGDSSRVDWRWSTTGELLSAYECQGVAVNVAYLVPHGSLRASAMGYALREASTDELAVMRAMLAESLNEGAWGMSTGLWYAPMKAAGITENITLTRTAGFVATHQRDYGDRLFEATAESIEIAKSAAVPVQISHLQMNGRINRGRASELLDLLNTARSNGADITCDTYPYTAGSTVLQAILPAGIAGETPDEILESLRDEKTRSAIAFALDDGRDWSKYVVSGASSAEFGQFEGVDFASAAQLMGQSIGEFICNMIVGEQLRACFIHHAAYEQNLETIMSWRHNMCGSDGLHLPGRCHPRLYGTFPRLLRRYVYDRPVLTLQDAIYKMTSAPATRLGLRDRGQLCKGYFADVVVIDPKLVRDTATFENPKEFPEGIVHVWCNGVQVKAHGQPTRKLAGRVLRR